MAQRNSQRAPAQMRGSPSIITQGLGRVAPQSQQGMFSTHVAPAQLAPIGDSRKGSSPLLANILSSLGNLADSAVERSKQMAYLDGAAAAGVGASEQELQANPLTRAWAVAGHRDTTGSLALAQYEAGIASAMTSLREQGPEAVQDYLRQARNKVMPVVGAMTREGRENALASLLTIDRKAIATHNVEHSKFIVDQEMKAKTARITTGLDGLNAVRGTPAYVAARDSLFTTAVTEIQFAQGLSADDKSKLTLDFLSLAMRQGHLGMYELYKSYPVLPDGRGGHITMSQMMSFEDQLKVSKAYEESRSYHKNALGSDMWKTVTDFETMMLMGEAVPQSEYNSHLDNMVEQRLMDNPTAHSYRMKFARLAKDSYDTGTLATAYITGNPGDLVRLGSTTKKAMEAAEKSWAANDPTLDTPTVIGRHLSIGVNHGWPESFKRVGELMQPAISAMMSADFEDISPEQSAIVQSLWQDYEKVTDEGKEEMRSAILSPLSDEQKMFMSNILYSMKQDGMPPKEAVFQARKVQQEMNDMSAPVRRELARTQKETDDAIVESARDVTGWYNVFRRLVMSNLPGTEASAFGDLRPTARFRSNDTVVYNEALTFSNELGKELDSFNERGLLFSDPSKKRDSAIANVRSRTVPVQFKDLNSNLILPRGTSMNEFFDLPPSYSPEAIGQALGQMYYRDDATPLFTVQEGQLKVEYYNNRGDAAPIGTELRDPVEVGQQARLVREKEDSNSVLVFGEGKVIKGQDGAEVRFNGENTAGVDPRDAFFVRETLVRVEGIKNKPYKDGIVNGKQQYSIGVGINTGNPTFYPKVGPDGKIDNATISATFMEASDYFINEAQRYINEANLDVVNKKELLALSTHLLYQTSPQLFVKQVAPLFEAIAVGDPNAAFNALVATNAYKASGADRKSLYTELVQKAVRNY